MKLEPHPLCPMRGITTFRREPGITYQSAQSVALQERDPATRQMKTVGVRCRRCGAVKMEGWTAWVKAS